MTLEGRGNAECEATIPITVLASTGRANDLTAVIDTGFNGYLTLPPSSIESLGLMFHSLALTELGDGREVALRKFQGRVQWFGSLRDITVLEAGGGPLVGMALLKQHRLTIDVVAGGEVVILPLD